ncbi:sushi, von Willebrand factor type A, EGF and pentraxin domain-containing protein 1 isoform X1 [Hydra vulgaris]|uniref:sushi, von Willebrand factor type A, EGF and pentraxin domain-containing protein 1 isoform X1 n=1 Tax=Hydra vulgaris TaxID=6087 RepID=UPI001F5FBFDA|nr:sushi, von Willebrand factor type A, EGF and pentraxin domain-containing protein 1 [Hydra vulgaris]
MAVFFLFIIYNLLCFITPSNACQSNSKCSWTVCHTSYSEYLPKPNPGSCTLQTSNGRNTITTHSKSGNCPKNQGCSEPARYRTWCLCQEVDSCWWSTWSEWSGNINQGSCGHQRRYRSAQKVFKYIEKPNCHNAVVNCKNDQDSESRTWCSCKKINSCQTSEWTLWSSFPNPNTCSTQTRKRDLVATYIYEGQENNCDGITDTCPNRSLDDLRVLCNCPFKECIEGEWTSWELHTWNGNCPTERRLKQYREVVKYKEAFVNCDGVGPKICPDPVGHLRDKEITCPSLPAPLYGKHDNLACNGVNSKCQSICKISCNKGFKLSGSSYLTCQGNGSWNGVLGTCKDIEPPTIICPVLKSEFFNLPNTNYSIIDLPEATATDNIGLAPKITVDKSSPLKVFVKNDVLVKYTATDSSGNQRSCEVKLSVKDNEPPKIVSCPSDKVFQTGQIPYEVYWDEPIFHDNVDEFHVNVFPSHQSGSYFPRGKHTITYLARDQSFNIVNCTFTVQVDLKACPLYDPPENGALKCNIMKNDVVETYICTVSCKADHWFLQGDDLPQFYNFYVCGEEEQWRGQNEISSSNPVFFVPIQKGNKPWPDCSVQNVAENIKTHFQMFAGKCGDATQQLHMKQAFINAMKNDIVIDNLFCKLSDDHCTVENIVIVCSPNSYNALNSMTIEFTLNIYAKNQNITRLTQNIVSAMKSSVNEKVFKGIFTDYKGFVSSASVVTCRDGYEYKQINESNKEKQCIQCGRGMYFDRSSSKCKVCDIGTYQSQEAQTFCIKCPNNTSTVGKYAKDYQLCKAMCKPGTYSANGLEVCYACPIGTYQPMRMSTHCIPCPPGKVNSNVGSTTQDECLLAGLDIIIRSEGCGDPDITKACGISTIFVNSIQYSLMKRGMNFVAVNGYTGKLIESVAFDWHEDFLACEKTYSWVEKLQNSSIILVAAQDEATNVAFNKCFAALQILGGKPPFQREYRSSFAMIGFKGIHSETMIEQKKNGFGMGSTTITKNIQLLMKN